MDSHSVAPRLGRRFVLTVIACAVVPLGLVGLWTTRSAARSGVALLQSQLEATLAQTTSDVEQRWLSRRSDMLLLSENEPVRQLLRDSTRRGETPEFVRKAWDQLTAFNRIVIRDRRGVARITLETPPLSASLVREPGVGIDVRGVDVRVPVIDLISGDTIGSVEGVIRAGSLLPSVGAAPANAETPLTAMFVPGGGSIVPPSIAETVFRAPSSSWRGARWVSVRRRLAQPALELVVAGRADSYVQPFERSARSGALALLVATIGVVVVITIVTRRMTRQIERELAQREALAAVGEFASELAHEVRNPLTAVRLDLQRVGEVAGSVDDVQRISTRVLRQIERIDRAVTGALRVARGGSIERRSVDVRAVLDAACRSAEPEFAHRRSLLRVERDGAERLELDGDAAALEQLFLNLLINAAQASSPGGETRVAAARHNGSVEVTIVDAGTGMSAEQLQRLDEPFRTSKRDGTGLGLKIARRIVASHRGRLALESTAGRGTTVRIVLPL